MVEDGGTERAGCVDCQLSSLGRLSRKRPKYVLNRNESLAASERPSAGW